MTAGSDRAQMNSQMKLIASFVLPGIIVVTLIFVLIAFQASAETTAAKIVNLLPIGFAFAAGMVASMNPCGFLLLPSYISYHLGTDGGSLCLLFRQFVRQIRPASAIRGHQTVRLRAGAVQLRDL